MAKKIKITRKELLKEPDQFLSSSEKAMLFFTKNRSTVIISIFIFLVLLLIATSNNINFGSYDIFFPVGKESDYPIHLYPTTK